MAARPGHRAVSLRPLRGLLLCPSGEAAFGSCSPPRHASPFSLREASLLAGPAGGRMRARAPPRPSPHAPAPATGQGDPRRGPSLFSSLAQDARSEPSTPRRGSPVRDPRAQKPMATLGTGGLNDPPAHMAEVLLKDERPDIAHSQRQDRGLAGGWWPRPPSGRRPMAPERAGPERASRGGVSLAPTEGFSEGGEQRGTPPRDALLGRTRRRVGGRRGGAARATRPQPAGQNRTGLTQ
jgi:hypothetical protein